MWKQDDGYAFLFLNLDKVLRSVLIERLPLRVAILISNVPYVTKMADGHVVRLEFDLEDLTAEKKKTTKKKHLQSSGELDYIWQVARVPIIVINNVSKNANWLLITHFQRRCRGRW